MELNELKSWIKEDSEDPNVLNEIAELKIAAEEYLAGAEIKVDYTKKLYKLAIKLLVSHWYENRTILGKSDELPYNIKPIITQLKYTQEDVII